MRKLTAVILAAMFTGLMVVSASAETFKFVGSTFRSCWEDTEGFTDAPDLQPIALPPSGSPGTHFLRLTTTSSSATTVFDSDGTVTSNDLTSTAIRNTTTSRVGVSQVDCTGTWALDPSTQRVSTVSTCSFENTIGGTSTGTLTSQTLYQLAGTTLVRVDPTTPVVETVNVLTGPGAPFSYQRVCGASGALHFSP